MALRGVRGLLFDISGVMYEGGSSGPVAVPGSVDAVRRVHEAGLPLRFCTNESQTTRVILATKLQGLGFDICSEDILSPAPAVCRILRERSLRPHLLVYPDALPEYHGIDLRDPNCVVIGDAAKYFTYDRLNEAFQLLLKLPQPLLFCLGKGKYYKETDGLKLDVGAFTCALEYACNIKAEVVGKPSPAFFTAAVQELQLEPCQVAMIGDDLVGDVGGAQNCGLLGILVRTGKFRPEDEHHPSVTPHTVVDDLSAAVSLILQE
uniref:phospholysine phosphohistidine inorganic pyrophosphate phosphatase-like n=1 Tax=Myxine glutinosa TaxID=7769 RepID=UPI00358EBA69